MTSQDGQVGAALVDVAVAPAIEQSGDNGALRLPVWYPAAGYIGVRRFPSRILSLLIRIAWIAANVFVWVVGVAVGHPGRPVGADQAYSLGMQLLTGHRFTPGPVVELAVLGLTLASIRWIVLQYRAFLGSGPVEVRPLTNATVAATDTSELDVAFRDYLTRPRLYRVTTLPGDREPENFIEILRAPSAAGWRGLAAAAYSYALPRRAFIVSATLRKRDQSPRYGVSVQVRRLPGQATEIGTQWSSSFDRALQRAAFAVCAHILPQTRRCRNAPWPNWRGREIPVSLFRSYQRAKMMVAERRYDEALNLYRQALIDDAANIGMRYDVGQLYERIGLYPDALLTYLHLVNEIFPPRHADNGELRRTSIPRWKPERSRDPFIIRYRYAVSLGMGAPLVQGLIDPGWERLRQWLSRQEADESGPDKDEERPWRVSELLDIRRILAQELVQLFPKESLTGMAAQGRNLKSPLGASADAERYLLDCAKEETRLLCGDFRRARSRLRLSTALRRKTALTLTAMRLLELALEYRSERLKAGAAESWQPGVDQIGQQMAEKGYRVEASTSWLEHYNAACVYALMLIEDDIEIPEHRKYAYAAVEALQRALIFGEDIDFIRAKRYWLQAGDPDLAGLRRYGCFRAFEARIYGVPFPADLDLAKYELYLHLRTLLENGSGQLEQAWRRRAAQMPIELTTVDFEEWWRREEHAWEIAIRLGRFYPQWQTRNAALEALRNWTESFGVEALPIPYPNISRIDYLPDVKELDEVRDVIDATEGIFDFLGTACGRLAPALTDNPSTALDNARAWKAYAETCALTSDGAPRPWPALSAACVSRAAVWAALRQWANSPNDTRQQAFATSIAQLPLPPQPRVGTAPSLESVPASRSASADS